MKTCRLAWRACIFLSVPLLTSAVHAGVTPWVDFEIHNGHLVLPTQIQGIDGHSMIDTGAQVSFIERSFLSQHQLKFEPAGRFKIIGVAGTQMRDSYRNVPVTLMGSEIKFRRLVEGNFSDRLQLTIGGDFLANLYFQFDYPNKRLRGITRDTFDLKKIKNVPSKLDPATRQPMVKVRLNDEADVWLVMDTGNAGGVFLKRRTATKRKWLSRFNATRGTSRGAVKTAQTETFRLPVLAVGPYDVKNARVTVPAEGQRLAMFKRHVSASAPRQKTQGLLGYDVWKNFLVTIDYRSGAIFIEIPQAQDTAETAGAK